MKSTAEEAMKVLTELKSQLRDIAAGFKCPEQYTLCSSTYSISCNSSSGLMFTELEQQLVKQTNYAQAVEQFNITLLEQVSIAYSIIVSCLDLCSPLTEQPGESRL